MICNSDRLKCYFLHLYGKRIKNFVRNRCGSDRYACKGGAMKTFSADYICSMIAILILLTLLPTAYGQSSTFEVASIKPSALGPGGGIRGGPGTKDPGRWTCQNAGLSAVVRAAFDLKPFQLEAASWLKNEFFDIVTKVPEGATKEQFQQMKQNLLVERFGLKFHREKKEIEGYELVVTKNGPKFKESGPEPPKDSVANPEAVSPLPFKYDKDGFPVIPPGRTQQVIIAVGPGAEGVVGGNGIWVRTPMEKIVTFISDQLSKPVSDNTALKGKYDLSLSWASLPIGSAVPPVPGTERSALASEPSRTNNIFTALQEQLGLKLQPKKIMTEILVIDHIEKIPTEN
jgi:uncharacterized protein (TIGR03435 family)